MTRIVALGITALAACSSVRAEERREVHIDIGANGAPLIATVHVEDYRAASIDLLTKSSATGESRMTRFLRSYYETGRAGDTKRFASLFGPEVKADSDEYTQQTLSEQFLDLRSVRLSAVFHWGEYELGLVEYDGKVGEGTRRWSGAHAARCVGDTCLIAGHFENGLVGRLVADAFANKRDAQVAVPVQGEPLPILPAVDGAQKAVATDPIVLHLNRSSDQTALAVSTVVATFTKNPRLATLYSADIPTRVDVFEQGNAVSAYGYDAYVTWFSEHAPWTVTSVYSLGPDVCLALLKSNKDRALHWMPLQRAGDGWKIISDPTRLGGWHVLSSGSTYQALARQGH